MNGGYDREHNGFCPGTIVTWLNVRAAYELCEREGKEMRYSFGKPTEAYKDRWCDARRWGLRCRYKLMSRVIPGFYHCSSGTAGHTIFQGLRHR